LQTYTCDQPGSAKLPGFRFRAGHMRRPKVIVPTMAAIKLRLQVRQADFIGLAVGADRDRMATMVVRAIDQQAADA
jgi:hypothetical protein